MPRPLLTMACLLGLAACQSPVTTPPPAEGTSTPRPAAQNPSDAAAAAPTPWQCGDQRIGARVDNTARNVSLEIDGKTLTLAQSPAASGARYADATGNAFWNKGDEATLALAGRTAVDCRQASQDSPWDAARARGSVFRGLGTEPGWTVEIGAGATPRLLAELDYGERRIEVAQASRTEEGYVGSTAEGLAVSLTTKREPCNDGMSDNAYPASATLTVGGRTYRGCGRFLTE